MFVRQWHYPLLTQRNALADCLAGGFRIGRHHPGRRCGGSLLAAGLAGFLAVALFAPDRNEQLIQDLPVLQNLDEYCQIDSIEFLQMLNQQGLFNEENGED